MKSKAPSLMQSTAVLMSAWPEIITTAASRPISMNFASTSVPSIPGILMSQKMTSYFSFSTFWSATSPSSAVSTS